jgi:hypothetical protein
MDKRRHKREDIIKAMECLSYQQSNQVIEFDCIIANLSQSGVCLLARDALKNGQEITIRDHIFPSPRIATVLWNKEYNGLYYKYGLEFK